MSIYHCHISNVSRGRNASALAALAYMTGDKIYDERQRRNFNYARKERVAETGFLLPEGADATFHNAAQLFNSLEAYEKAANARTAKRIEVALPRELSAEDRSAVIKAFIADNLTKNGYAAAYAIHDDPQDHNPHAHILVANRQLVGDKWQPLKRKMVYDLDQNGQRIPILNPDGTSKLGKRNAKQWKRHSEEVNPLDQKQTLEDLRQAWASVCNERLPREKAIDHRTFEAQGIGRIPLLNESRADRRRAAQGLSAPSVDQNKKIRAANAADQSRRQLTQRAAEDLQRMAAAAAEAERIRADAPPKAAENAPKTDDLHAAASVQRAENAPKTDDLHAAASVQRAENAPERQTTAPMKADHRPQVAIDKSRSELMTVHVTDLHAAVAALEIMPQATFERKLRKTVLDGCTAFINGTHGHDPKMKITKGAWSDIKEGKTAERITAALKEVFQRLKALVRARER